MHARIARGGDGGAGGAGVGREARVARGEGGGERAPVNFFGVLVSSKGQQQLSFFLDPTQPVHHLLKEKKKGTSSLYKTIIKLMQQPPSEYNSHQADITTTKLIQQPSS